MPAPTAYSGSTSDRMQGSHSMSRLNLKLLAPLVVIVVVGGLALVGSSLGSKATAPAATSAGNVVVKGAWLGFQQHLEVAVPVLEADIGTISNGGSDGFITAASSGLDQARIHALDELAWLAANPPAQCYAAVHADYLAVNRALADAMAAAAKGDYTTANNLIGELNAALARLAADTPKTVC
jgi:hypothetical protein